MPTQAPLVESSFVKLTALHGVPRASSLQVSEHFGKQHKDVLKAVHNLEIPDDFRERNFALSKYKPAGSRRSYPHYLMTRDGFALLAMGFTGKTAMEWKLKFLAAFNRMEAELSTSRQPADPQLLERLRAEQLHQRKRIEALDKQHLLLMESIRLALLIRQAEVGHS